MLVPAASIYVSPRRLVKIDTNVQRSLSKIFLECLMFSSSLQLHASDCPYNSMPRTFGLTRATEIGSRRLTKDTEKFPEKERIENKSKRKDFSKIRLYSGILKKGLRAT